MWRYRTNQSLMIHTGTSGISCALIKAGQNRVHLTAYHAFAGDVTASTMRDHIKVFKHKNKLNMIPLYLALSHPLVHESFVRLDHASPQLTDFINPVTKKLIWDYRYMHTLDNGQHLFYLCGMPRSTLFHYQLIAHTLDLDLRVITSSYMAAINAYAILFGQTFRQSQLTTDLIKNNYKLEESIDNHVLLQQLHIDQHIMIDLAQEKASLLSAIGLFYFGQEGFHAAN